MKHLSILVAFGAMGFPLAGLEVWAAGPAPTQDRIYRCGNEYTNNAADALARGCKLLQGGNVTVIQAPRPAPGARPASAPGQPSSGAPGASRVDSDDQRSRDTDARAILEGELRRSENKLADLQKEYNGGEPERRGDEARNYQKYLDRTSELKAAIARTESDIASLKRELGRASGAMTSTSPVAR